MISNSSGLSLENTSLFDNICDAIGTAGKAITQIKVTDLPQLWESIVGALKSLGEAVVRQIKDFFFKDLPGLIIDVGRILVSLAKRDMDSVRKVADSALRHLMGVLEFLSLVPMFAVVCSILLASIYACRQDWFNAVCALI